MFYGHYPIFSEKISVKSLMLYSDPRGYSWEIEDDVGNHGHYTTNKFGEGLFIYDERDGSETQLSGTCQFQLTQKTDSGRRRYIKKWFEGR